MSTSCASEQAVVVDEPRRASQPLMRRMLATVRVPEARLAPVSSTSA